MMMLVLLDGVAKFLLLSWILISWSSSQMRDQQDAEKYLKRAQKPAHQTNNLN